MWFFFYRMKIYHATYIMKSRLILSFRNLKNHRHEFFLIFLNLKKSKKVKWIRISDPWSVFLMDLDMDWSLKNLVPIRSESEFEKINGYEYGFRLIWSKPDPLTCLVIIIFVEILSIYPFFICLICQIRNWTSHIFLLTNSNLKPSVKKIPLELAPCCSSK